jgi:hypothetical protein
MLRIEKIPISAPAMSGWRAFGSWLAPESEPDEALVDRRITDLLENRNTADSIRDLEPLAHGFSSRIGIKATVPLVKALVTFRRDDATLESTLNILHQLVRDDSLNSQANAGAIVNEENALSNVVECFGHTRGSVRVAAFVLFRDFVRLELAKVQSNLMENPRAQDLVIGLVRDSQELIRRNFLYLLPDLVQGKLELQQLFAFNLIDPLADLLAAQSADVVPAMTALLAANPVSQKLFVQTGHLKKLIGTVKSGDDKVVSLLTLLFASSEMFSYQKSIAESGLIEPIIELSLSSSRSREKYWALLGYLVRASLDFCSALRPGLERLIRTIITTQDSTERNSGLLLLQSYSLKGAQILAEVICDEMAAAQILSNFATSQSETMTLLSIAKSCVIANRDVLPSFFDPEKSLLNEAVMIVAQTASSPVAALQSGLEFIGAAIWESGVACERFVTQVAAFQVEGKQSALVSLVSLCLRETQEPLRSVACLSVLESLLFKTSALAFSQMVTIVRSHVGVSELTSVVAAYSKAIADERTLWSEFVQDAFRVIQRNSDALLVDGVEVRSDSTQIAALQTKLSETMKQVGDLSKQNEKLSQEVAEKAQEIADLETQKQDLVSTISVWESMLKSTQESQLQLQAQKEKLESEAEGLKRGTSPGESSQAEIEKLQEACDSFLRENRRLQDQLEAQNLELQELREVHDDHRDGDSVEVGQLKKDNAALKKDLDDVTELFESDMEDLRSQMEAADRRNEALQKELEASKATVQEMASENSRLTGVSLTQQEVEDQLRAELAQREKENREDQQALETMENDNASLRSEIETLRRTVNELRNQNASLAQVSTDGVASGEEDSRLQSELKQYANQNGQLVAENGILRQMLEDMTDHVTALQREKEAVESELKRKISELKTESEENRKASDLMKSKNGNLELELAGLRTDGERVAKELSLVKDDNSRLQKLLEQEAQTTNEKTEAEAKLKGQFEIANSEVTDLKAQLDALRSINASELKRLNEEKATIEEQSVKAHSELKAQLDELRSMSAKELKGLSEEKAAAERQMTKANSELKAQLEEVRSRSAREQKRLYNEKASLEKQMTNANSELLDLVSAAIVTFRREPTVER